MRKIAWWIFTAWVCLGVWIAACTPKRWIKDDPRTVTPEPTVTIDDSVKVDIGGNTSGAH